MSLELRAAFLLALLFGGKATAPAQLVWETREITLQAKPEEAETSARFVFTNPGRKPVTIVQAKSSCSCTLVQPEKKTYQPGESGHLEVKLVHGKRTGVQRNTVLVETDVPGDVAELVFAVTIPAWVEVSPPFALWKRGAPREAKEMELRLLKPELQLVQAAVEGKAFRLASEKTKGGAKLRVVPLSTQEPVRAAIRIVVRLPDGTPFESKAFAVVK